MTNDEIVKVARLALEYWFYPFEADLEPQQEQEIIDMYHERYEEAWDEVAGSIR